MAATRGGHSGHGPLGHRGRGTSGTRPKRLRHVNMRGWLWVLIAKVALSARSEHRGQRGDGQGTAVSTGHRPSVLFVVTRAY